MSETPIDRARRIIDWRPTCGCDLDSFPAIDHVGDEPPVPPAVRVDDEPRQD